jgi:hypothetical protein
VSFSSDQKDIAYLENGPEGLIGGTGVAVEKAGKAPQSPFLIYIDMNEI